MRLVRSIGLTRLAAILVGAALVLEVLRVQVLPETTTAAAACTVAEVVLVALAAGLFLLARRGASGPG